jgi:DNA gyrase subunit A
MLNAQYSVLSAPVRLDVLRLHILQSGVAGIAYRERQGVTLLANDKNDAIVIVTKNGIGKVTMADQFRVAGRGGKGVGAMSVTDESGPVIAAVGVKTGVGQSILLLTAKGMGLRVNVDDITPRSRTAGGVKLMTLEEGDKIMAVSF